MFIYLNKYLNLGYINQLLKVFINNNAAKRLSKILKFYKTFKHINIIYHFNRKVIKNKQAELYYVNTKKQIADILTKPVERLILDYLN